MKKVTVIRGDGIGPEVIGSAPEVLEALGAPIMVTDARMGLACYKETETYLPQETVDMLRESDAALFGAITSPTTYDRSYRSPLLRLRKEFDLYANIRPVRRSTPLSDWSTWTCGHRTGEHRGYVHRVRKGCLRRGDHRAHGNSTGLPEDCR